MQKYCSALILFLLLLNTAKAQSALRGRLTDTVNFSPLAYSTIMLVREADSVIAAFTRTAADGTFALDFVKPGNYRLLITRPSFADYEDFIAVANQPEVDLGSIVMVSKANLLKEVIIREKASAIRIRGDTTEFLVDSFLTNKNSNVEDLLKKLPGIQVDKNGKITAQGQEVKKVLVDGEEFFGNDPTMATRNLRAEDVEKIQVFDKQSDQAAFSGIDDGEKNKTINLQLKEEAKKGYFGRVGAAGGTNERYDAEALFNAFKNKRKLSGYAMSNNINKMNLNWDDAEKFGSGNNMEYNEQEGYFYSTFNDDYEFNQIGIPRSTFSGINYSDKVANDKHSYNISLTQKNLYANGFERNFTKFILPDTLYYNNQNRDVVNNKDKYGINLSYEWAVDSFNTFRIKTYAATQSTSDLSSTVADNRNENEALVNQNERLNRYNATTQNINTSLLWMRKFRTTGRSLSLKLEYGHDNRNSDELLQSTLRFFDTAQQVINSLTLDQMQLDRSRNNRINTTINYTEPLSKKVFVLTDYSLNVIQSNRSRTVNAKSNNEYTLFLDSLSNALDYSSYVHTGGLSLRYVYKKWNATAGGKVGYTELEQFNQIADTGFSQNFINIFPSASIQFKRKNTSNINLRYNGSTRQPTIEQLQPLRDLTNPLLIEVGNPNLVQSFTNRISLNYNSYQPIKGRGMYMSLTGRFIQDDFTQSEEVDAFGRRTVQTINTDGNADMWGFITFWYEIKKLNLDINLNLNPSLNRRVNRVNQRENVNLSQQISFGPSLNYDLEEVIELSARADWGFNNNTSTLRPDVVTRFWISTYTLDTRIKLPAKFEFSSDCVFNIRQQTADFRQNLNTVIWNAAITKRFLKSDAIALSVEAFDLLNQNLGFQRNNETNFVNERVYSILQRYFLLRLSWNFTKGRVEQDED